MAGLRMLQYFESTVYVSTLGADISTCGWSDLPCLTLDQAVSQTTDVAALVTVSLVAGSHAAETTTTTISIAKDLTITGAPLTDTASLFTTTKDVASTPGPLLTITSPLKNSNSLVKIQSI